MGALRSPLENVSRSAASCFWPGFGSVPVKNASTTENESDCSSGSQSNVPICSQRVTESAIIDWIVGMYDVSASRSKAGISIRFRRRSSKKSYGLRSQSRVSPRNGMPSRPGGSFNASCATSACVLIEPFDDVGAVLLVPVAAEPPLRPVVEGDQLL